MDNETKEFLVQLFDVRFAEQDKKIEARFAEQDKKIEARFAEQDKKFEAIDQRFVEQDKRFEAIDQRFAEIDQRFIEQREYFKTEFSRLTADVTNIVGEILEVMDRQFKKERKKTNKDIKTIALLK